MVPKRASRDSELGAHTGGLKVVHNCAIRGLYRASWIFRGGAPLRCSSLIGIPK